MQAFGLDADRSGLEPLAAMGVGLQGFRVWGLRSCRLDVSIRVMSGYSSIGPRFGGLTPADDRGCQVQRW